MFEHQRPRDKSKRPRRERGICQLCGLPDPLRPVVIERGRHRLVFCAACARGLRGWLVRHVGSAA